MQFIAIVLAFLVPMAPAQKPTAEFRERFTALTPERLPGTPWFTEFGAQISIASARADKPLDSYAVSQGLCTYGQACAFRLSVLLFLEDSGGVLVPVGVRYLLDRPDGLRAEGFARTSVPGGPFRFHRYRDSSWVVLAGPQAALEERFVSATVKYVAAQ